MDCDSEKIWRIIESYRQNISKRKIPPGVTPTFTDHLFDCYFDCTQTASDKKFRCAVNLLHNVDSHHARVSLIINLYSDDQGYSIMLCSSEGTISEEVLLPYEDNEIFSYFDNQELPPILLEVLKQTHRCTLYEGCVICEVRDHRGKVSGDYEKQFLLLQPTLETVLATVSKISREMKCTAEERVYLESQLIFATQPPICLDPSTEVVCVTNRLHYNRRKFHSYSVRRYLRQISHAYRARMNVTAESSAPERLKLHDFISKRNTPGGSSKSACIDFWKRSEFQSTHFTPSDEIMKTVQLYAKSLPGDNFSDLLTQVVEMEATPPASRLPSSRVPTSVDEFLNTNLHIVSPQLKVAKQPVAPTTTTQPLTANLVSNLTSNVTPNPTSNVTSNPTSNVTPNPTSNVTPNPTSNVTSNPTSNVTPNPTSNVTPNPTSNVTQHLSSNLTPNLSPNITANLPSLISSLTPTPGLLDLLRPQQVRKGPRPIAPATSAPSTVSMPVTVTPVVSASVATTPSILVTQQAAEKTTSITKPSVVNQAKLPSPSQAGTSTAVVVVSPISGNTGGQAIVNIPRESWTAATPPLRHPPAAGSYFLSSSPNVQVLPVLQRPPVVSPQQASIPSSLPKLNPMTPPKVMASTAPSGKTQVMSMPQLHKLSPTVTKISAASQQPTPTPGLNHPVTYSSSEKDCRTNTKESSGTSKP